MPTRIALVDDQKLFRRGLRMILEDCGDIEVAFEAGNGQQFFERLAFEPVDLVLLDVEMPVLDGTATLERIRQEQPDIRTIILTMHDNNRLITHLMELGANGFLLKDEEPEIVCESVRRVMQEGVYFRDYVSKALLNKSRLAAPGRPNALIKAQLSERELEVLYLLCKEYTNQEIAEKLFLSRRTVENHRRHILEKVGAKNLAGLVIYAVENGII